jgi:hypothetical protein
MTAHDVRIADERWLLDGRHYRFTVAQLSADARTHDQRSLGVVMHSSGTVNVGIVAPGAAVAVSLTLDEAHALGRALLALEPRGDSGEPVRGGYLL